MLLGLHAYSATKGRYSLRIFLGSNSHLNLVSAILATDQSWLHTYLAPKLCKVSGRIKNCNFGVLKVISIFQKSTESFLFFSLKNIELGNQLLIMTLFLYNYFWSTLGSEKYKNAILKILGIPHLTIIGI